MNNASCTFIVLNAWEWYLLHKNEWTIVKALMWTSCKLKDFKSKLGFSGMEMIDWNKVMFFELDIVTFVLKLGYWNYDQVCTIILFLFW
jgi:hypothetical protein